MLQLDDGTCIGESVAICRYMESIQSEPALFGATGVEAAKVEMWQRRAELRFLARSRWSVSQHHRFFKRPGTCVAEWGQVCAERHRRCLRCLMSNWRKRRLLAGDNFSIADITLAVALDFARMVKVVEIPELPNIQRW